MRPIDKEVADMVERIEMMVGSSYKKYSTFVKALISFETECQDEEILDQVYQEFLEDRNLPSFLIPFLVDRTRELERKKEEEEEERRQYFGTREAAIEAFERGAVIHALYLAEQREVTLRYRMPDSNLFVVSFEDKYIVVSVYDLIDFYKQS